MVPAKVTLCAIVRDEEKNLAGGVTDFLDESLPFVNEAIVVDTGSKDRTKAILESYSRRHPNLKVFNTRWQGFAHARNYSLDQATNKWILVLDADERLTLYEYLKINYLIQRQDIDGYYLNFTTKDSQGRILGTAITENDDGLVLLSGDIIPTIRIPPVRLFKKIRLDGIKHRYLTISNDQERINYVGAKYAASNLTIFHYIHSSEEQELKMLGMYDLKPPTNISNVIGRIKPAKKEFN